MDSNKNVNTNATNNTEATNANTNPPVMMDNQELAKMKAAYATFEAESRKNRTFGEKLVESLPYVVSGLALAGAGVAIGVSAKALNTTTKVLEETRATVYTPSPDGELE